MTTPIYAVGINRTIVLAEESTFGVQAAGPGQVLRRTSFAMDDQPPEIQSTEITQNAQLLDSHLGMPTVSGTLAGQLSPGTYKSVLEGLLRSTWTAGVSVTGLSDTSVTVNGDTTITIASSGTNLLSAGFKNGKVIRMSGLTGDPAVMNGLNLLVTGVAAHTITCAPNLAAVSYGSGQASVTIAVTGKTLMVPTAGNQVARSYSIEDWQSDTGRSRLGRGLKFAQASLNIQPNGYVGLQASLTGKNIDHSSSHVYSSPTDQSTSLGVRSVAGKVLYGGSELGYVSSFSLQISQALQPAMTIGATDGTVQIAGGTITARGSIQVLTTPDSLQTDFLREHDVEIMLYMPCSTSGTDDFVVAYIPRTRLVSSQRQDSDRLILRSFNFGGLQKIGGGTGTAFNNTTIELQDSLA